MADNREQDKRMREFYRREEQRRKKLGKREIEHVRKTDSTDRRGEDSSNRA